LRQPACHASTAIVAATAWLGHVSRSPAEPFFESALLSPWPPDGRWGSEAKAADRLAWYAYG